MLTRLQSVAFVGLDAVPVEVEVDVSLHPEKISLVIVGLPDTAVKESKDRVLAAVKNSGISLKCLMGTINLAPGDLRKEGPLYDLPIALGLISSLQPTPLFSTSYPYLVVGELGLSGEVRPMYGALAVAMLAKALGKKGILIPAQNAAEAAAVEGLDVIPITSLAEGLRFLKNPQALAPHPPTKAPLSPLTKALVDFSDIKAQAQAKRALEIAAAGGHNVLMSGPPGTGKTLLAKAFVGILPTLTLEEALEITKVHSVAGLLPEGQSLVTQRPFRSPHHSVSHVGLIGGGSVPKPGEVSLAHHGVLFLDELPEFSRKALEVLRQPLEDGKVTISRAQGHLTFPTRFTCVAAMNPCPCGYLGHPDKPCRDSQLQILRYRQKISGPLWDRLDIHIEVPALRYHDLMHGAPSESSATIRPRVQQARNLQIQRFGPHGKTNAHMTPQDLKVYCKLSQEGQEIMRQVMDTMGVSARGFDRLLKVARTIADLSQSDQIATEHLMEAVQFRSSQS